MRLRPFRLQQLRRLARPRHLRVPPPRHLMLSPRRSNDFVRRLSRVFVLRPSLRSSQAPWWTSLASLHRVRAKGRSGHPKTMLRRRRKRPPDRGCYLRFHFVGRLVGRMPCPHHLSRLLLLTSVGGLTEQRRIGRRLSTRAGSLAIPVS